MKQDQKIDWRKLLGYPGIYEEISFFSFIYERLEEKVCPIHKTPMYCYDRLRLHHDYVRVRYRCSNESCLSRADFVGDELKIDKVCDTVTYVSNFLEEKHIAKQPLTPLSTDAANLFISYPFADKK